MAVWEAYLREQQPRFLEELKAFLRLPSISALPEHAADTRRAAEWVAGRLGAAGLAEVALLPTGGPPLVTGAWRGAPGRPTVLVYGHYDVQPVDPLDAWTSPPFQPEVRKGRLYARGASDDKGNVLIPILAVEALLRTAGALPVNVVFFLEGEEEVGSPHLPEALAAHRERFRCDAVLNADTGQWSEEQPALFGGLRGLCALQLDVRGPAADLHSGLYGGAVQNPIHALVRLLDSMRSPDGRVLVEGFYDEVAALGAEERAELARVPFDEAAYRRQLGVDALFGEPGFGTYERLWVRPTLEVNGIWGGFQGEGSKTVLPSSAHAKITCRLVPDQDPERIAALVQRHAERHTPPGVRAEARRLPGLAYPYVTPPDHPVGRAAAAVLTELYGRRPFPTRSGGSISAPVLFQRELGAATVGFGFALDDERFHAPNEFFRLASFARGQRAYAMLLERLGAPGA